MTSGCKVQVVQVVPVHFKEDMPVEQIIDGIRDLIKKNLIAQTNVTSNVTTGDVIINVENSFQFYPDQEIILIDWGYNDSSHVHYQQYEYSRVKEVNNTGSMTLHTPIIGNWTLADKSFVQKTIGHDPLYDDRVYYGDRAVIPAEGVSITVDPQTLTNDWIYFRNDNVKGLSEDYKINIRIYTKDIETEVGYKILTKYSDAVYKVLNDNLQIDVNDYDSYLMTDVPSGTNQIVVEDTPINRRYFIPSIAPTNALYGVQDNENVSKFVFIDNVVYSGGRITITLVENVQSTFLTSDMATFIRYGRYIYDARANSITYNVIQKGSALMRVAEIGWFGKEVNDIQFTQHSRGVDYHSEHY